MMQQLLLKKKPYLINVGLIFYLLRIKNLLTVRAFLNKFIINNKPLNKKLMRTFKLKKLSFFLFLFLLGLTGCEEVDFYSIDAPDDLKHKIDSLAALNNSSGDTTHIIIANPIVGSEDNSTGWWGAFSDYFTIPSKKLLHLEFINNSSGVNNWNNWNLCISNVADREADNYKEYFVLRADAWGWGGKMADEGYPFDLNMITHNYPDKNENGDIWDDFRSLMQGAYVTLEIDHSATGNVFVTAQAKAADGTILEQKYQQPVSATEDIVAFLITDNSHFILKKAYLIPSKVNVVEDVLPVSLTVEGYPTFIEIGDENFWGNAVATVTFADGSSKQVDSVDLSFNVIPDMTSTGNKTVVVAYNKTKQGKLTKAVSTIYNLTVTNSVTQLEVTTLPIITIYYYFNSDSIFFNTRGLVVTATYSDGSQAVISNEMLKFSKIPAKSGTQSVVITYTGATKTVTTTCPVTLVKGISQVGNTDFSSGWWTVFSEELNVPSGTTKTFTFYCYSDNANNWNSPSTILRKADKTEYAVVRMDNFGWGSGYTTAVLTNDWNWDTFKENISGSRVVITVKNNGDNTADVTYNVTYANGETHFQKYAGITVESSDLYCALVTEHSYLIFVNSKK